MKTKIVLLLLLLLLALGIAELQAQVSVASPHLDVQGPLYVRQNYHTLNKNANGWVAWGTRDTSTPEATINLSNINNAFLKGNLVVGSSSALAPLHVSSPATSLGSTSSYDANFIVQSTSGTRSTSEGAAIGFVLPSKTDGSGTWQQGRILVTPDNTYNVNAAGRMFLQTRYIGNGAWRWRNNLVLTSNGSVGIGTETMGTHLLAVEGTIGAREIKVEANGWSDFVFEDEYELPTLKEVEAHITEKGHLKDIPSAKDVGENGFYLGEMDAKLLQKIEELTLYTLQQEKKIERLQKENKEFQLLNEKFLMLQKRVEQLE